MKTTSLELSKQLKEAGAEQDADKWWWEDPYGKRRWAVKGVGGFGNSPYEWNRVYATFGCHELLERLPFNSIVIRLALELYHANCLELRGNNPCRGIIAAEALGKLYLWCLQNGHCEVIS